MASYTLQTPPRVAHASRLGQKMASYALQRHLGWRMQAAWANWNLAAPAPWLIVS